MPRIDDMLDQLSGKKVFSTLDAKSGYWQVPLEETSRSKTAFSTSNGLYQFRVMPFGLCNAPATFQRVIQQILSGLGGSSPFCCAYIDDILVFSDNIEQHMQHLQQVFERIRSAGLLLHPKKCQFAQGSTTYLGHVITGNGILPDPNKTRAVQDFPIPTSVKAVRQFLGLSSYYRRFVANFSKIAAPLHALTRQNVAFKWTSQCQCTLEQLKARLTQSPVLIYPNFDLPFALHTDASKDGLGAVLEQESDGHSHPVAYASRTLSKSETNYSATELEALAVVWALRHFRAYLLGHKCIIYTDHAPLKASLTAKYSSGRRARWSETMAEFNIDICYKPGRKNNNADALSRAPIDTSNHSTQGSILALTDQPVDNPPPLHAPTVADVDHQDLITHQQADDCLKRIIEQVRHNTPPAADRRHKAVWDAFAILDGILYYMDPGSHRLRLAVPKVLQQQLMEETHAGAFSGHFAAKGMYRKLATQYWWKGMYTDIYHHCRSCLTCASISGGGHRHHPPLQPLPVGAPFERVGIDVMEMPQTCQGNRYVLVIVDYLTKWTEAFPMQDQSSETIARLFADNVICRHGVPNQLLSDRGTNLLSDLILDICVLTGMKKINTTCYHPQTDGLVENFNKTLRSMIAKHVKQFGMDWDKYLHHLLFAYRTKPHESTGESPFYLLYGRDARIPTEGALYASPTLHMLDAADYRTELVTGLSTAWDLARTCIAKAQKKQKLQYDKHSKPPTYRLGDRVMVYMPHETSGKDRKLSLPYHGPYRVIDIRGNCVSLTPVDNPDKEPILVNMDRIVPCHAEVPDSSWLGYGHSDAPKRQHKYSPTAITPARPADHHYCTRSKDTSV